MYDLAPTKLKVVPLNRETLQERVYRQICDLILDGEIVPGQLVTIQAMADAFGVSHMPVREALKRLASANVLTVVSGRSIGIPQLSRDRLMDLYNVRLEVEPLAGAWAAKRISPDELEFLQEECQELKESGASENVKTYLRANRAFHFSIYRAARSESLLAIIENLWLQIGPYLNLLRGTGNLSVSDRHHQRMLECLRARDEAGTRQAVRADIEDAYDVLLKLLT
ncbi:MAG TPA: GntR family transcriptional regulator [Aestuariivirga sp.]|nr:GntR family transcriptional regulator [Alphaproteobacteria bacterium]HRX35147.1 GntR family transcriptional regulator [Aestuariivirga sp.]